MYTIYKQGFLFTEMNDKWKWKHLVLNGNPLSTNFTRVHDQIFFIWSLNGMGYKVGWSRQIPLKRTNTCSMNMGQVQFILNLNILSWGPYKIPFLFLPPPFERLVFWDRMCLWRWATQLVSCDSVGMDQLGLIGHNHLLRLTLGHKDQP